MQFFRLDDEYYYRQRTNSNNSTASNNNNNNNSNDAANAKAQAEAAAKAEAEKKARIEALKQKKAEINGQIGDKDKLIKEYNQKIADTKTKINNLSAEIKKLTELKTNYTDIYNSLDAADRDFGSGGYIQGGKSFHSDEFQGMLNTIDGDKTIVDGIINSLNIEKDKLNTTLSGYNQTINGLNYQKSELEKQLKQLK